MKINFDGSVVNGSSARGFISRDANGRPIISMASYFSNNSVPVAEALALRSSLMEARRRGIARLEVEGDSKLVIDAVNGVFDPPWRLVKISNDIKSISNDFLYVKFSHIIKRRKYCY